MPNKMMIDASHPEETRVVVVRGNRIEEFDFESQDRKQLKGNIYLARVTRVEPSLQAAFVEYGGNRHGFLAFSEIHPDYYQIPVADRQALLRAEAAEAEDEDDEDGDGEERQGRGRGGRHRRRGGRGRDRNGDSPRHAAGSGESEDGGPHPVESVASPAEDQPEPSEHVEHVDESAEDGEPRSMAAAVDVDVVSEKVPEPQITENENGGVIEEVHSSRGDEHEVESVGAEDALEEVRNRRKPVRRQYKIQEVVKRRQILLVQVVKEERGNKGAALTTYLSLAGRYSVLMPNTARGGGISRKITNAQDRKRLKEVVADLEVPQGMGVILRTAGESRTKAEIKRDYEYLMRLWENVRNLTLQSTAPALVYEEGSLIKRSVRDLYNKDIDEILVSGEEGYREAKDFMRMLMPSHAKVVQPFRDTTPIFARNGIEAQLDKILQPQVTLKSGGYIIINQTEALVAIDVNSGRSTKEHSIEDTALQTNLEAAEEVARQLRLRDLAGLIVIDFIDMEENRNNRSVEKRLKDHLKNDRARIQVGRISHFGLLEMSRQRIRASVLESTMKPCAHCGGTGHVRSDSSIALMVVRAIEEFLLKDSRSHIICKTSAYTALYVLNHKRGSLVEMENRFGVSISIEADETVGAQHHAIFRGAIADKPLTPAAAIAAPAPTAADLQDEEYVAIEDDEGEEAVAVASAEQPREHQSREHQSREQHPRRDDGEEGNRDRKRRRRRRKRGGRDRDRENGHPEEARPGQAASVPSEDNESEDDGSPDMDGDAGETQPAALETAEGASAKKRQRGKRGGKRNRREDEGLQSEDAAGELEAIAEPSDETASPAEDAAEPAAVEVVEAAAPEPKAPARRRSRAKATDAKAATEASVEPAPEAAADPVPAAPEEPTRARPSRRKPSESQAAPAEVVVSSAVTPEEAVAAEEKPKKAGWWQRKGFF